MQEVDELAVTEEELHEATSNLGNWHEVAGKQQYLVNREECLSCLCDLLIQLDPRRSGAEKCNLVHLKLGEWKVVSDHLVPLFTSYREDPDISGTVLRVLVELTSRTAHKRVDQLKHLEHLQDCKEAFAKRDVFIIVMGLLVENMDDEEIEDPADEGGENAQAAGGQQRAQKADTFRRVLTLLRNLVSVPDPSPGDAGFTPLRRHIQLVYIRNFYEEGVLDFFHLFAEQLVSEKNPPDEAWALGDILYHICTQLSPEEVVKARSETKSKLLTYVKDMRAPTRASTRHSRFGTAMQTRTAEGVLGVTSSVLPTATVAKGSRLWRKEFQDPNARSDSKANMFHDPYFTDLEEGTVRDHNQLNPHVRNSLANSRNLSANVLVGLLKFFDEFVKTSLSPLVSMLRTTAAGDKSEHEMQITRGKLLNFVSWMLEFHRYNFTTARDRAKLAKTEPPIICVASIQGAIDLDMIQYTTTRIREYGKGANMHPSMLVVSLRAVAQQVKTIEVVVDSKDPDTRECGEVLTQILVKDDVMSHLSWIFKNFKSSSHDPRILSYSVEIFHHVLRLMKTLSDRKGQKLEFQEVSSLADAMIVENLFYLLERYKQHSLALNSMLVKLIYGIVRASPTNIVVFFELAYFTRIHRIMSDPIVKDKQNNRFSEMVVLLRYILRQFFKCSETNKCAFVELMFRKVLDSAKDSLLDSHTSEFAAILDNYENEDYARILDRMNLGESIASMRRRQREVLTGTLPWTPLEDEVLKSRYSLYADHPLCADLLAAELPEESNRNARQVRRRLMELQLLRGNALDKGMHVERAIDSDVDDEDGNKFVSGWQPPQKKLKGDDVGLKSGTGEALPRSHFTSPAYVSSTDQDETMLECDLERLLDEAIAAEGAELGHSVDLELDSCEQDLEARIDLEAALSRIMDEEEGK